MITDIRVHVMARPPLPGRVKTRLQPVLGAAGCACLARRLLDATLAVARAADVGPVTLWAAHWPRHPALVAAAGRHGAALAAQRGRDLGERMAFVARRSFNVGALPILVGTDCPSLRPEDLQAAAEALHGDCDAVVGPALDGGYYLLGLASPCASIFRLMAWGGDGVLETTLRRLERAGMRCRLLPRRRDLDRPGDLRGVSLFLAAQGVGTEGLG